MKVLYCGKLSFSEENTYFFVGRGHDPAEAPIYLSCMDLC